MHVPAMGLRKRILFLFLCTSLGFIGLVLRVGYLQVVRGAELREAAFDNRLWDVKVEARRGAILDRHGRELAVSVDAESVYAVPAEVRDPQATARALAEALGMDEAEVYRRITRPVSFWWVRRKVPDEAARAVRALDLPGIYLTQESRRVYPKGSLAAHVLGFVGIDNQGLAGVEYAYDRQLRGRDGMIRVEFDARGREIPHALQRFVPGEDGHTLVLTIDEDIQYIIERELHRAMLAHRARQGMILVMDPRTGDILGMAYEPTFDPNRYQEYPPERWRNPGLTETLPPGSAFKPLTAAMALDLGVVTPETGFYDPGHLQVPGHVIRNWDRRGLGATTFAEGFQESANTIFAATALRVGVDEFYRYLQAFGITSRTGIDLPGEGVGIVPPRKAVKPVDLAVMGFGQTLTVTPVQMLAAIAALANDGVMMRPRVVRELRDAEGRVVEALEPRPLRQVVSPSTADTVLALMERVVSQGTGLRAAVPGYRVGGKTGTSQKVEGGRIAPGKYIASFIGVAPVDDPRVVVYVIFDEPQGVYYGGWVAAPVFAAVTRDILRVLDVPPSPGVDQAGGRTAAPPPEPTPVPAVTNLPLEEAKRILGYAGFRHRLEGEGATVGDQFPSAGARVLPGTTVVLYLGDARPGPEEALTPVTVPDLTGVSREEAAARLAALGLRLDAVGDGRAVAQDPPPGTRVPGGTFVTVQFLDGEGQDGPPASGP